MALKAVFGGINRHLDSAIPELSGPGCNDV